MSSKRYIDEVVSVYKGHDFFVKLQRLGHRCGYVRVNDSTLFSKIQNWYNWWNNQDFDFDVHGGITFVNQSTGDDYLPGMNWIGFDCAHYGADCPDREATLNAFDDLLGSELTILSTFHNSPYGTVRSKEYVVSECKWLIDQLIGYGDSKEPSSI